MSYSKFYRQMIDLADQFAVTYFTNEGKITGDLNAPYYTYNGIVYNNKTGKELYSANLGILY